MAKAPKPQKSEESAPQGEGGSYVIGEDGVRRLVERTEDRVIRSAEEVNPPVAKPGQ